MDKYIELEPNKVYTHIDGGQYKCVADPYRGKLLRRVSDGWTFKPHDVRADENGAIYWSYSEGGRWEK